MNLYILPIETFEEHIRADLNIFKRDTFLYQYKEDGNVKAIIEMKKCVGAMKLAGSHHLAKTYEGHLEKILASS